MEWPWLLDSSLELEMHYQLVLSAEKLDQELHENVKHIGFVDVSYGVECQSLGWVHY